MPFFIMDENSQKTHFKMFLNRIAIDFAIRDLVHHPKLRNHVKMSRKYCRGLKRRGNIYKIQKYHRTKIPKHENCQSPKRSRCKKWRKRNIHPEKMSQYKNVKYIVKIVWILKYRKTVDPQISATFPYTLHIIK